MTTDVHKQAYLHQKHQCPICGVASAGAEKAIKHTNPHSDPLKKPKPGDYSVCAGCGTINQFTRKGMVRLSAYALLALAVFDRPLYLHLSKKSLSFREQIQSGCQFPSDS